MEVVNEKSAYLSNFEVFDIVKKIKEDSKGKNKKKLSNNYSTVLYETTKYLEKTACNNQSPEKIQNFLKAVDNLPFKLTKCEKLTMINIAPTTQIEIQCIVEDAEERLVINPDGPEDQTDPIDDILELVSTHLGNSSPEETIGEAK